ncbi:MAG: hypothetical protein ABSG46_14655 [Candidatus Binataceae bacterium]|jgi:hypothetical protein
MIGYASEWRNLLPILNPIFRPGEVFKRLRKHHAEQLKARRNAKI